MEWIVVCTATLRREFEAQARALWAALVCSLQASCRADSAELDAFLASAALTLDNKQPPNNPKALAEMSIKHKALQDKMPEVGPLFLFCVTPASR